MFLTTYPTGEIRSSKRCLAGYKKKEKKKKKSRLEEGVVIDFSHDEECGNLLSPSVQNLSDISSDECLTSSNDDNEGNIFLLIFLDDLFFLFCSTMVDFINNDNERNILLHIFLEDLFFYFVLQWSTSLTIIRNEIFYCIFFLKTCFFYFILLDKKIQTYFTVCI